MNDVIRSNIWESTPKRRDSTKVRVVLRSRLSTERFCGVNDVIRRKSLRHDWLIWAGSAGGMENLPLCPLKKCVIQVWSVDLKRRQKFWKCLRELKIKELIVLAITTLPTPMEVTPTPTTIRVSCCFPLFFSFWLSKFIYQVEASPAATTTLVPDTPSTKEATESHSMRTPMPDSVAIPTPILLDHPEERDLLAKSNWSPWALESWK